MNRTELPDSCSHCGNRLRLDEWHPIKATTDDDGEFRVYAFCDDACKEAWERKRNVAPADEATGDS